MLSYSLAALESEEDKRRFTELYEEIMCVPSRRRSVF